jgi:hypothetical protein
MSHVVRFPSKGPKPTRVFHSSLTQHCYAVRVYRERENGLVEVTGKKDDVTKDVQGIVSLVAGDLWNAANNVIEIVAMHDPAAAFALEQAIEEYEKFMFDDESVVLP